MNDTSIVAGNAAILWPPFGASVAGYPAVKIYRREVNRLAFARLLACYDAASTTAEPSGIER